MLERTQLFVADVEILVNSERTVKAFDNIVNRLPEFFIDHKLDLRAEIRDCLNFQLLRRTDLVDYQLANLEGEPETVFLLQQPIFCVFMHAHYLIVGV